MRKLADKNRWDLVHSRRKGQVAVTKADHAHSLRRYARKVLGKYSEYFTDYAQYLFTQKLKLFLATGTGYKAVEIGSAPGYRILNLHKTFGFQPYGIEYSATGVELNRRLFSENGLDTTNVIHADFFSNDLITTYHEFFDIVLSHGFIEHFDNPHEVITRHLQLLKRGGWLIVTIPNKLGINGLIGRFFKPDMEEYHNLELMKLENFRKAFEHSGLQCNYCGLLGIFKWTQFPIAENSKKYWLWYLCRRSQLPLNFLFRILWSTGGPETGLLSPYLIFIGRKIGD